MFRLTLIFSFFVVLLAGCSNSNSSLQMVSTNLKGRQYSLEKNEYLSLPYDREYSNNGSVYVTIYKTYNPNSGNAIHKITVTHDISKSQIKVNVKAVFGGMFVPDDLNFELPVTDEYRNFKTWGKPGFYRQLVGNSVPYETKVQFATTNFNYVNLLEIQSEIDNGQRYWYYLDDPLKNE